MTMRCVGGRSFGLVMFFYRIDNTQHIRGNRLLATTMHTNYVLITHLIIQLLKEESEQDGRSVKLIRLSGNVFVLVLGLAIAGVALLSEKLFDKRNKRHTMQVGPAI